MEWTTVYTVSYTHLIDSLDFKEGTRSINYDIIEGLTGILSYCSLFHDQEVANAVLVKGLQKLVTLTNNKMCIRDRDKRRRETGENYKYKPLYI